MKYAIIIPTYNEEENIEELTKLIFETLKTEDFSIIFVDDSPNNLTANKITEAKEKYKNIILFKGSEKSGLATAYIEGMKKARELGFDWVIQMDADLSHNPKYLPTMFELLKTNDLVIGSRNIKGGDVPDWGILRKIISKGGSLYSKFILSCKINDLTGGFNGWRMELLDKIGLNNIISKGYCFQIEMKYRASKLGAKITEFPIIFYDRKKGVSKMSKAIFFEALLNVIKLRFLR